MNQTFTRNLASKGKTPSLIRARYALCTVVFAFLAVGCGSDSTNTISQSIQTAVPSSQGFYATWKGPCSSGQGFDINALPIETLVFNSDGTFLIGLKGVITPGGTYDETYSQNKGILILFFPNSAHPATGDLSYYFTMSGDTISGNTMTLIEP